MICRTAAMALFAPMDDGWRPTSNGSVDHDTLPITCHWKREADEARCPEVMELIGETWTWQVDELGFVAPMLTDEDGRFDVYISNDGTGGGAYVAGSGVDEDPEDGRSGSHAYMALDPNITEAELESYVIHEFQHVLQYATDFNEPSLPVWEGVAEAVTWYALAGTDYEPPSSWAVHFQRDAFSGILADGYLLEADYDLYSFYEYGSILWILSLDHHHGDGAGQGPVELWQSLAQEGWENEPDVLDAWGELAGGTWQEALLDFSLERAWVGTEDAPAWVGPYTLESLAVPVDEAVAAEELPADLVPVNPPLSTGVVYFQITGLEAGQTVSVEVTEGGEIEWGLVLTDGSTHATVDGGSTELTSAEGGDLLVGVVSFGKSGFDADAPIKQTAADFVLAVDLVEASADDGAGDEGGDGSGGGGEEPEGCGCAGASAPAGLGLLLAGLVGIAGRRRR